MAVKGRVESRPEGMANPNLSTGEIDIEASELKILNESETPPFLIEAGSDANEEVRLRHRYLDLRRPTCNPTSCCGTAYHKPRGDTFPTAASSRSRPRFS